MAALAARAARCSRQGLDCRMRDSVVLKFLAGKFGGRYYLGPICHCIPPGCTCQQGSGLECSRGHRHILREGQP